VRRLVWALLLLPSPALAIGLEGPADADRRYGGGIASGWDQVGGIGRDAFPFAELFAHADARLWRGLAMGAALSVRGDFANYNFALERWRGASPGAAAQLVLGYDGPTYHLSAGAWLLSDGRDGRSARPALLPWGVVRLRVGSLDHWHVNLRLIDGAPYTAEGGGTGLRLQLGAPPRGAHRMAAGLYTSLGEKTVGLSFSDEIARPLPGWQADVRFGGLLGTDYGHPGARPELTVFAGLVW
jgi:hypothetical protein